MSRYSRGAKRFSCVPSGRDPGGIGKLSTSEPVPPAAVLSLVVENHRRAPNPCFTPTEDETRIDRPPFHAGRDSFRAGCINAEDKGHEEEIGSEQRRINFSFGWTAEESSERIGLLSKGKSDRTSVKLRAEKKRRRRKKEKLIVTRDLQQSAVQLKIHYSFL